MNGGWLRPSWPSAGSAAALALLIGVAAGCGSSSSSGTASTSSSSGSTSATSSPSVASAKAYADKYLQPATGIGNGSSLPSAAPKGKTFVEMATAEPGAADYYNALKAALKAIGWKYEQVTYDNSNPQTIQTGFASALALHPTVVSEAGLAPTEFGASTIPDYAKAGVPIIVAAADPVTVTKTILGTPAGGANGVISARILANWFVADSNGSGKAVIVNLPAFSIFGAFVSTFQKTVSQLCPKCSVKIVNLTLPEFTGGTANNVVVSTMRTSPGYKYLFFTDAGFGDGITSALSAAGLSGIKIGGQAMDTYAAGELQSGTEAAWTALPRTVEAYETVDIALRFVEHVPLTTLDNVFPTQLFTPANIGKTSDYTGPPDSLAQFEKLWHVPTTGPNG
jgi:ribose transport system substrate-binding protein